MRLALTIALGLWLAGINAQEGVSPALCAVQPNSCPLQGKPHFDDSHGHGLDLKKRQHTKTLSNEKLLGTGLVKTYEPTTVPFQEIDVPEFKHPKSSDPLNKLNDVAKRMFRALFGKDTAMESPCLEEMPIIHPRHADPEPEPRGGGGSSSGSSRGSSSSGSSSGGGRSAGSSSSGSPKGSGPAPASKGSSSSGNKSGSSGSSKSPKMPKIPKLKLPGSHGHHGHHGGPGTEDDVSSGAQIATAPDSISYIGLPAILLVWFMIIEM